jgi:outer membrane protein assembly factor BamA
MPRFPRAASGLLLLFACASARAEPLRVGHITIRSLNVFSPQEAASGWFYRVADALHITTRTSIVNRFLLFQEGDVYDPELLAQTERNLRDLPFIKLASVTPSAPHDGVVDVEVITQDGWTTEIGGSLGSKGGVTTYGVNLSEKDLLGSGRTIAVGYDKSSERITRSFEFKDPYLFRPYWSTALLLAKTSDGHEEQLEIQRPFFSFVAPWSADVFVDNLRQNEKLYRDGEVDEQFRQDHHFARLFYGVALSATATRAHRLTVGFDSQEDSFQTLPDRPADVLPNDRKFRYLSLLYEDVSNKFLKLNYVDRDLRYEDFNLGRQLSLGLAISPQALGADGTTGRLEATVAQGWQLGAQSFLLGKVAYSTRFGPVNSNTVLSATGFLAIKLDSDLIQTFVTRLEVDRGWDLDRDVQFFADGLNGLRGYRIYSFEGNKRIIWNLEHRIFSGREILHLVAPGAVAFVDTGTAVPEGTPLTIRSFKTDVGVGLRFGIARAPSNNILRVDFAYAFNRDPRGRRGFLASFSSSQAF